MAINYDAYGTSIFGGPRVWDSTPNRPVPAAPTMTTSTPGGVGQLAGGSSTGPLRPGTPEYTAAAKAYERSLATARPPTASTGSANPFSVAPTGGQPQAQPLMFSQQPGNVGGVPLPQTPTSPIGFEQNPYYANAQGAANMAGQFAGQQGQANVGQADMLRGGAGAVMNTAFDPQQGLYDRTLRQVQEQQRTGQAARGITSSPYGAGLENQALSNFNIDWQNAQLGRQTQGLEAAGGASGQAGNIGQMGVGQTQAAGQLPWGAYQQQQDSNIQNWIAYMNQRNIEGGLAQQNYPLQLQEQSFRNYGGVPFIPQSQPVKLSF